VRGLLLLLCALLAAPLEARITAVSPPPGQPLEPGMNIILSLSPPMEPAEFLALETLIAVRDERRGVLRWFPAAIGEAPYAQVALIQQDGWVPGSWVRLEMRVDSTLADSISLEQARFRWPFLSPVDEWLGREDARSHPLFGPASGSLDLLPLDFNRDGILDLSVALRDQLYLFGVDTCAATPEFPAGEFFPFPLGDWSLERRLAPMSLGTNAAGQLHPAESLLLHSGGQQERVRLLVRTGSNVVPEFDLLVLEDPSFQNSPKLALPWREPGPRLCQDLLVATRGGEIHLLPAAADCSQLEPDSARVVYSGLGDPLDLLLVGGAALPSQGVTDWLIVLDASPEPIKVLGWNGAGFDLAWTAPPDSVQNLRHLVAWSDFDPAGRPDLLAWGEDGRVVVISEIDAVNARASTSLWHYGEALRDVAVLPEGAVVFAGHSSLGISFDPRLPGHEPLSADPLPGVPRRLRALNYNSDFDTDLVVLFEDEQVWVYTDEVIGPARLQQPEELRFEAAAVGDTLGGVFRLRNRSADTALELSVPGPPADPAFPFSWTGFGPLLLAPGDSLDLPLLALPQAPVDSCWASGQLRVLWSVPGCPNQQGQRATRLCLQAGYAAVALSADSLMLGTSCGGHSDCPGDCPGDSLLIANPGAGTLRLLAARLLPHPDDSLSAPESFCLAAEPPAEIAPGESASLALQFCPPMSEPWPWLQGARLELRFRGAGADSLRLVELRGLLACPWPPVFTGPVPALTEDLPRSVDLAPIIADPDNALDELELRVIGVTGTGGQHPDSLLIVDGQQGFELNLRPRNHANSVLFPELALVMELRDPSGNLTRDTVAVPIEPVDDAPWIVAQPGPRTALREGRGQELLFDWREVDGDSTARLLRLFADAAHQQPLGEWGAPAAGPWNPVLTPQPGDSALYGGVWHWSFRITDLGTAAGYEALAGGRFDLYTRPDTLQLREDEAATVDLASWFFPPDAETEGWSATLTAVLGTGGLPPDSVLQAERLDPLVFRLQPGADLNSDILPELALRFRLNRAGEPERSETLPLAIQPLEDDPRLESPADPLLRENEARTLRWRVFDVDGDAFAGWFLLAADGAGTDTLAWRSISGGEEEIVLQLEPATGDSLRSGGRWRWRIEAQDQPPATGALSASGELPIRQAPQDLRLALLESLPRQALYGDTLRPALRVSSATGYVGGLTITAEVDLVETARLVWPWIDTGPGTVLDTVLTLPLPIAGGESCWRLRLLPGNPAENPADNELGDCLSLAPEHLGSVGNAFSPNGDGINDEMVFTFGRRPARAAYRVEIYDLNGRRLVARTLPAGETQWRWDGRVDGRELLPGVVIYALLDGGTVIARGQLGVVR
jgi:hypothetical protein